VWNSPEDGQDGIEPYSFDSHVDPELEARDAVVKRVDVAESDLAVANVVCSDATRNTSEEGGALLLSSDDAVYVLLTLLDMGVRSERSEDGQTS
jgi:hypothetical protein